MEDILANNEADFISLCRPLIINRISPILKNRTAGNISLHFSQSLLGRRARRGHWLQVPVGVNLYSNKDVSQKV